MKRISRTLIGLAVIGALACSGDEGPNYASEIDEANMEGAAETSYDVVGDIIDGMMNGSPSADIPLAPAFEGATFADRLLADIRARGNQRSGRPELASAPGLRLVSMVCEEVETGIDEFGDPIDTDEDGIPDDYKLSFPANCTEVEGEWTYTYSGSVRVRDIAGMYAYRIDIANLKFKQVHTSGSEYSFSANGTEQAVYAASGAEHSAHLTYADRIVESDAPTVDGPSAAAPEVFNITFSWDEETSFDPDSPLSLEAEIPSGEFDIDMTLRAIFSGGGEEEGAFRFHLTTPEELYYNTESCDGIDDGSLKGALNDSEDIWFLITWTGCGSTTYQSNGTTDGGELPASRPFARR
jgi:hypothetical protein